MNASPFVLIPFLAGLLFGPTLIADFGDLEVLIPFLAGLLFGLRARLEWRHWLRLNPLFGGSAFRTGCDRHPRIGAWS